MASLSRVLFAPQKMRTKKEPFFRGTTTIAQALPRVKALARLFRPVCVESPSLLCYDGRVNEPRALFCRAPRI
ncbi:hypothetical protein HMPREF0262_03339 [Clostridium sp. ATCC 29733]|nr:hypothetical protein HMPREF0262_03339 [Clostridium sp. ATCC 29733]